MPNGAVKLYVKENAPGTPIVFGGPPGGVEVELWLQNDRDEPLTIDSATLIAPKVLDLGSDESELSVTVPSSVPAHDRVLVTVSFNIGPFVPPEAYDATMKFTAGAEELVFPAQIVVLQNYDLSVDPDQFVFKASAADVVSGHVIVRNDGNVPVEVTVMGEYPLRDPWRPVCCVQADAEPVLGFRRDSGSYSELSAQSDDKDGDFGSVIVENENATLAPGNWRVIRFTVRFPDSLPSNAHLRARPRIGTERFNLDILTPPEDAAPKPKRKAKTPEKGV
jgi:hypothetical protein